VRLQRHRFVDAVLQGDMPTFHAGLANRLNAVQKKIVEMVLGDGLRRGRDADGQLNDATQCLRRRTLQRDAFFFFPTPQPIRNR